MLIFQDPTHSDSTQLLETLRESFNSARKLVGAFAFASSRGVHLFARNEEFRRVATEHSVDIVVGIDAVTTVPALEKLLEVARDFPNVRARAFLNPRPESKFHPKFCWMRSDQGGRLIAGSGNLTEGGLLSNWEAYSVEDMSEAGIATVEAEWDAWAARHEASLLPLDDANVRLRALQNNVLALEGDLPALIAPPANQPVIEPETTLLVPGSGEVLVAEIPKNRAGQVNFRQEDYKGFFGAREGATRFVTFRRVNADGSMGEYEFSQVVISQSRNFRFELDGAAVGLDFEDRSAIGVYIQIGKRNFFYQIITPVDVEFQVIRGILERLAGQPVMSNRGGRLVPDMRRTRLTVSELRREWPDAPFWHLPNTA